MDARTGEIVTVQLGEFANFVGAHYWNLQAQSFDDGLELDYYLEFEEKNRSMAPRLVSVGWKGSYSDGNAIATKPDSKQRQQHEWDGETQVIERECAPLTSYQRALHIEDEQYRAQQSGRDARVELDDSLRAAVQLADYGLEEEVRSWSGFLRPRLREESIYELSEHQFSDDKSAVEQHGEYEDGLEIMKEGKDDYEAILDRCRHQAERCGSVAQWKVLVDVEGLFGGIGVGAVDMLLDNGLASRSTVLACSLSSSPADTVASGATHHRDVYGMLATTYLAQECGMCLPFAAADYGDRRFPRLRVKSNSWFHSSALIAVGLDTITLPSRMAGSRSTPSALLHSLAAPMAAMSLAMPLSLQSMAVPLFTLKRDELKPLQHQTWLAPLVNVHKMCQPFAQVVAARGYSDTEVEALTGSIGGKDRRGGGLGACTSLADLVVTYEQHSGTAHVMNHCYESPLALPTGFPHRMFDIRPSGMEEPHERKTHVAVMAHLQSGRALQPYMEQIIGRCTDAKVHLGSSSATTQEVCEGALDFLHRFRDACIE